MQDFLRTIKLGFFIASISLIMIPIGIASGDAPLLQLSDLKYQGAFRVPQDGNFDFGGGVVAYNPINNSLFIVGNAQTQQVAEISIPTIVNSTSRDSLTTAQYLQTFHDISDGKMSTLASGDHYIGGLMVYSSNLIIGTAYVYFDNSGEQKSHFTSSLNLAQTGDAQGMFRVGSMGGGIVGGYMTQIPPEWQSILGGPAITGQCCIPIITRTSYGPSAFVFNPNDLGNSDPAPDIPLLYYTQANPLRGPNEPQSGDQWQATSNYFNGATMMGGVVFPPGTRSLLFFGRQGTGEFCYGPPYNDPACDGADKWSSNHGCHAYPYRYQIWAYDANDLAAVKNGTKQPWSLMPQIWPFDLPFERNEDGRVISATYDSGNQRIFIAAGLQDGSSSSYLPNPIIYVYKVDIPGASIPDATPPAAPKGLRTKMKTGFAFLLLAFFLLAPPAPTPAWGATYHVAKTGSDSNPGTMGSPFLTIARGIAVLSGGDTLYIRTGTYVEAISNSIPSGSGTSWDSCTPTTVAAYPGETVVIMPSSGDHVVYLWSGQSYIVLDHLILDGTNLDPSDFNHGCMRFGGDEHHVKLTDCELRHSPGTGGWDSRGGSIWYTHCKIHDNNLAGVGGTLAHGLYIGGGPGSIVEYCEIYNHVGYGITAYDSSFSGNGSNYIIRNNILYNNSTDYYNGGTETTCTNNLSGDATLPAGNGNVRSSNPLFVNAGSHDFHLQTNSPAKDVGYNLSGIVTTDFDGVPRPQGSSYDIGAYEHRQSGSDTTPPAPPIGVRIR